MKTRHFIILISIGITISLAPFLVLTQFSYSLTGEDSVEDLLSRSDLTSITVTGESSLKIEPDQVSIILNVQTPPKVMNSTVSDRAETVKKVVESIISNAELNQTSIKIGQITINPIYSGGSPQQPATLFNAYSSVQINTDTDNLAMLSSNLISAGYRLDNIQIAQVKVPTNKIISNSTADVSIVFGSSTPNSLEFYSPNDITVEPGTTVVWTNNDSATHTVTSGMPSIGPTGLFDSSLFSPGETFEYRFDTFGVHDYFCLVHPWMAGTVTVPEGDESTPTQTKYQINMNVAIETPPAPLGDTIKDYEEKLDSLKKILESSGLPSDSIQSTQVNFNPVSYGYGGGQYSLYTTYTQIIVRTDLTKVESVLNATKDSGGSVENISMSVSDSKIDDIKAELTQQALQDAINNAQAIVEPSGLQIKGIKTIQVNADPVFQYGGGPVMYRGVNIWTQYDPAYLRIGEASVSVTAEFEVGK
jgi:uncharacterized protein YggE